MMISAKSRYALRVMVDLAQRNTGEFIPVKEIAARQGISLKYLESIMTILTKGKMLESASGKGGGYQIVPMLSKSDILRTTRGYQGGYRLARRPEDYTARDILRLTEGSLAPVACLCDDGKKCERTTECTTLPFWKGLETVINDYLESTTLQDMICDADTRTESSCMS